MIEVSAERSGSGWVATVRVRQARGDTRHEVTVSDAELERLGGGDPADLVRRSFEFLLEREPADAILRTFAIGEIGRYFPEYESEIRVRRA